MFKKFPFYKQLDMMDCGPTCLKMIARHYGKTYSLPYLRERSHFTRSGVSVKGIIEAAEHIGFRAMPVKIPFNDDLTPSLAEAPLPCIVHWNQQHFVVVYKYSKSAVWISDPGSGQYKLSHEAFKKSWISDGNNGIALLLETTPEFYSHEGEVIDKTGFLFLFKYLRPYRKYLINWY